MSIRLFIRLSPNSSGLSGLKSVLSPFKPQVSPLKLPIGIFRPYLSLLRPQFRLLNAFSQPSKASHSLLQVGRTKVPVCSTGLRPLWGRCPASPHSNSQSLKAGQRVSLTTYCPWATCLACFWPVMTPYQFSKH